MPCSTCPRRRSGRWPCSRSASTSSTGCSCSESPRRSEPAEAAPTDNDNHRKRRPHMSDLVAIAYDSVDTARQAAENVVQAQKGHLIELDDMVVVERRQDGKVKLHQPSATAGGAVGGALWGGLIGLIFFVPPFGM